MTEREQEQHDGRWYDALRHDERAAVELLALLEPCDVLVWTTLGGSVAADLERFVAHSIVARAGDVLSLAPSVAALTADALGRNPERRRDLQARIVHYYTARLHETHADHTSEVEDAWMRHVAALCELLLQHHPESLAAAVADAPLHLLRTPTHRHLVRYYQALGAGLCEQFDTARRALDALLAEPDLDDTTRGRALNSGATFARHQGDYEHALENYRASYALWQRLGNRLREGLAQMNQGMLHYYLQDYDNAARELQASLVLFEASDAVHQQGMAHTNLGLLARDQARWDEALAHWAAATAIFEQEGLSDYLGRVRNNVGEVELLRGNLDVAATCFEDALRLMTSRVYYVDLHINLGLVAQARGDDGGALPHYEAALALARELERHESIALIHYRIGYAQERLEHWDGARRSYEAAITAVEATRAPLRDESLMVSLMGRSQPIYEAAVELALARGAVAEAFEYAERARARAFADLLLRRGTDADDRQATPTTARAAQEALAPGTLVCAYFATGLPGPEGALLAAIPRSMTLLRACFVRPARTVLWTITRDAIQAHDCGIDPRTLLASSPFLVDGRRFLPAAIRRRLYRALVAPAELAMVGAHAVAVVPHGPLHQVPFAALLDHAGTPLLDRAPCLVYAPSVSVLVSAAPASPPPAQPCLAIGFDAADAQQLRHTEAEAATVARLCGGEAWRGDTGVCERLLQVAEAYRWLHLACHGEFDHDEPLQSSLMLGENQRLSASDILARMHLRAELVTLSACRSGVSRVLRGDEAMGLVRAFLMVGAGAVLVTLWPVEDTSARLFMERFYALLLGDAKGDMEQALHDAQRYLRDLRRADIRAHLGAWGETPADGAVDDERPYADAAYWAPYVLVARSRSAHTR
jgi:tetratricopeptide (TPR) repeat protein